MRAGAAAEFLNEHDLLSAARLLRDLGYRDLDAYTPCPIHGLEALLGLRRSPLARIVFPAALFGVVFAVFVQGYCNAQSYRLNVGGRPPFALPAFIPITFETLVLFSSLSAFFSLFLLCGLPRLSHPIFDIPDFQRASIDRYWLAVSASDPLFASDRTPGDLRTTTTQRVVFFGRIPA